jgi:VWFA-related protein
MPISYTSRTVALLLFGPFWLTAHASPKATESPTFKSTTRVVSVDVVVTDANGKPVHDLRAQDFRVLDNGKPQNISAFEERRSEATPRAAIALDLPENIFTNYVTRSEPGALTVLLFDTLNTEPQDQTVARDGMLNFLKKLPPGKKIALYSLGSQLRMLQSFTENPDQLIAAAQWLSIHSHWAYSNAKDLSASIGELKESAAVTQPKLLNRMIEVFAEEHDRKQGLRAQYTLDALVQLAHSLAILPERKNLIWISGGFPFDVSSNNPGLQKIAELLASTRIAVYPVDARGVVAMGATGLTRGSEIFGQPQSYETTSGQDQENTGITETMRNIAEITGGQAHFNNNDLEAAMTDSMQTGSNYYSLAYRPTGVEWNGKFRKIAITMSRPHVKLLYRSGYYAISDPSDLREDPSRVVAMAMQPDVPASTQLIMKARVVPPKTNEEATKVDILVDVHDLALTEEKGQKTPNVQFVAVAWDNTGKQCANFSEIFHAGSAAQLESMLRSGLQVHLDIPLKPGSYRLRLGVMDRLANRIGTLDVPLAIATGATAK